MTVQPTDFEAAFDALTGFPPLPWQSRLFEQYFSQGRLPCAIDVPTGLGKTAVIALWLIAVRAGAKLPRRLIYVVDRRAVVDQATSFVEALRERDKPGAELPISTLRGQHHDNRQWLEDPSRPAVVVGTIDMIGSRLLFEGYSVSRKMRPYQAGFLGADSLIVLDEAHLAPAFEALVADIESDRGKLSAPDPNDRQLIPPLRLLSLSATGRERAGERFRLSEADVDGEDSLTDRRLAAPKRLEIAPCDRKTLATELAKAAWSLAGQGTEACRILIYCNSRDEAEKTAKALEDLARRRAKNSEPRPDVSTELFIGARRAYERRIAAQTLLQLGFLAGTKGADDRPRFLVATSAGEVGVDLDADHMVCDVVAFERMVQRLGRVNRRGEGAAQVLALDPGPFEPKGAGSEEKARIAAAHEAVMSLLRRLPQGQEGLDASPGAIRALVQDAAPELRSLIARATTPSPLRPAISRPLLDAWSMTSLREHTGRPEVAPWLRGWIDDEPRTLLLWRAHLPLPQFNLAERALERTITDFFEAAPPHLEEQLETETRRVVDWLINRAKRLTGKTPPKQPTTDEADDADDSKPLHDDSIVAIALTTSGDLATKLRLKPLSDARKDRLQRDLAGKTLVVDRRFGGLARVGTLDAKEDAPPGWVADMAEEDPQSAIPWRLSAWSDGPPELQRGQRIRFRLVLKRNGEDEPSVGLDVYKVGQDSATEDDRALGNQQTLKAHRDCAAAKAAAIAEALALPEHWARLLVLAARLHDEGKQAPRWQRAFNAPSQDGPYAKTLGPVNQQLLDGYRHEFGSLFHAERDPELQALDPEDQDLVLHLIVAHHGHARPVISARGCEEAPPSVLNKRVRNVAMRFTRLQRRWGPWGLAWWEALLRAADQQASRENDEGGKR